MQGATWKTRLILAVLALVCAFFATRWLRPGVPPEAGKEQREREFAMGVSGAAPAGEPPAPALSPTADPARATPPRFPPEKP